MIDIHCHILWDIDDGPAELNESLAMARLSAADGIQKVVATPHIGRSIPDPKWIAEKVLQLNTVIADEGLDLEVFQGGDNLYNLGAARLKNYSINRTQYVLIEFPHTHLPRDAGDCIYEVLKHGLVPIITHPERNPSVINDPRLLHDLVERGALVQLTAGSLVGTFGMDVQMCARFLLKRKLVHFLASDAHSAQWRPPVLSAGLKVAEKLIGQEAARRLVVDHPGRVIRGEIWEV